MINKLDKILAQTMAVEKKLDCIVYVENVKTAEEFLKSEKIKILSTFPFINAVAINIETNKLNKILKHNSIKFVSSQANVFAMMNVAKQILKINSEKKGNGTTIAYIDTGIKPHLDFVLGGNRIVKFIDLINFKIFPYDDSGHGTFVCGVGSGNGAMSGGKFAGVAPQSKIISIKALDQNGEANAVRILQAMQWVFDNHKKYGIKVVCMSFGSDSLGQNDPIMKGAEQLWDSGITVVAAAGNSGPEYETIKSPGISPKILTVGGFDDNRIDDISFDKNFFEIADFSSRGPALKRYKPDVVAPSVNINSCGINEFYTKLSGTSVATPMIAGICALAYEQNPNIKPSVLKKMIMKSSNPITFNLNKEGFGIPNAENIFKNKP